MAVVDYDGELFIYFDNSSEFAPSDTLTSFTDSMTFHSGTQFFIYDENNVEIDITNLVVNEIYEGILEGCTFGFVWTDVAKQLYIFDTDGNDTAIIEYKNSKWVCSLNDTVVNALNIISVSNYDEQSLNADLTPYIGTKTSLVDEQPITDLTGVKLKFLDVVNLENGIWQINFKSNNQNFTSFTVEDASLKEYSITINCDYVNHTGSYININNRPTSIKAGETLTFHGTVYTNCDVECTGADLQYESASNLPGQFVPEIGTQPYTFTLSNATNDVVITFVDGNMLSNGVKEAPPLE